MKLGQIMDYSVHQRVAAHRSSFEGRDGRDHVLDDPKGASATSGKKLIFRGTNTFGPRCLSERSDYRARRCLVLAVFFGVCERPCRQAEDTIITIALLCESPWISERGQYLASAYARKAEVKSDQP